MARVVQLNRCKGCPPPSVEIQVERNNLASQSEMEDANLTESDTISGNETDTKDPVGTDPGDIGSNGMVEIVRKKTVRLSKKGNSSQKNTPLILMIKSRTTPKSAIRTISFFEKSNHFRITVATQGLTSEDLLERDSHRHGYRKNYGLITFQMTR